MDHELESVDEAKAVLPFSDLDAPEPLEPAPSTSARLLAFLGVLIGGLLGGLVGYGVGELMGGSTTWAAVGTLLGGLTGAIGVGVVANLTLRAMNEWNAVEHPEADKDDGKKWTRRPGT